MTTKKTVKKNYVYSIRITREQNKLLKSDTLIKEHIDNYIKTYLDMFTEK